VMSAVCYGSYYFLHQAFGAKNLVFGIIEAFVPIALGGVVFFVTTKILGVSEIDKLYNTFARKLRLKK